MPAGMVGVADVVDLEAEGVLEEVPRLLIQSGYPGGALAAATTIEV